MTFRWKVAIVGAFVGAIASLLVNDLICMAASHAPEDLGCLTPFLGYRLSAFSGSLVYSVLGLASGYLVATLVVTFADRRRRRTPEETSLRRSGP